MSMSTVAALPGKTSDSADPHNAWAYLQALSDAIIVVDRDLNIRFANMAAEDLLQSSRTQLSRQSLADYLPSDSPIYTLISQATGSGSSVAESDVTLDTRHRVIAHVAVHANPVMDASGAVVLAIREQAIVHQIDRQLSHRSAARSVSAMAAMMAHEVRNPLSGIKGAAQLLEGVVTAADRPLTGLICDEADRINELVDRIEVFSDRPTIIPDAVNIHEVLGRVRQSAENGFARHCRINEVYDPSLPPVSGDRDRLIQVFMNLVKNAAEAAAEQGGEVWIRTAYQSGMRIATAANDGFVRLPIAVSVEDNGDGVPEELGRHLFDPFVTTKSNGTGLGLALVAKIVEELGGVVEFERIENRTAFRVLLPALETGDKG